MLDQAPLLNGVTRSRRTADYALITPDTFVPTPLPGWTDATAVVHIAPEIGARFTHYTAEMAAGSVSGGPGAGVSRFAFVAEGAVAFEDSPPGGPAGQTLGTGEYFFLPPAEDRRFTAGQQGAKLIVFEKPYVPSGEGPASAVIGRAGDAPGEAFQGDADLLLQTLLPAEPAFDMAVNLFTYQPGARLPQVEVHVMEHGLIMLQGEGVYRLGDDWHPVQAGDIIWMASYCPQWFVAMGKQPAKYLYYKDVHRDRLTEKPGFAGREA
ncbi:MAG: (S)-ureidoglycine aminohydrolase [Planctomycetota bacterium]